MIHSLGPTLGSAEPRVTVSGFIITSDVGVVGVGVTHSDIGVVCLVTEGYAARELLS